MKSQLSVLALLLTGITFSSCEKYNPLTPSLGGADSPMADVGTTYSAYASGVDGVSSIDFSVASKANGVSVMKGSAIVTNTKLKAILSNFPEFGFTGDKISATGLEFKSTKNGFETVKGGFDPGILVKYESNVGDKYPITGTSTERTVISKSTTDDYPYGFMNIKTIQVEENYNKFGIKKIQYIANHKWGMVAFLFTFDDGSTAKFPITTSVSN